MDRCFFSGFVIKESDDLVGNFRLAMLHGQAASWSAFGCDLKRNVTIKYKFIFKMCHCLFTNPSTDLQTKARDQRVSIKNRQAIYRMRCLLMGIRYHKYTPQVLTKLLLY